MEKKISLYVTPTFVSVDVTNGVSRKVSGSSLNETIAGMNQEDKNCLFELCQAILAQDKKQIQQ